MNKAYCDSCQDLVPSKPVERDGRVFLLKECPTCGTAETLISGDADRYWKKRLLDTEYDYGACELDCLACGHRKRPNFLFVDVTNRCNLNCPICINNTPSMGFVFEPPLEYFDELFGQLAQWDPAPPVQLFGGEPTMREDLFEIIDLAKSHGLPARVVTNGIRLADEEYCRKLVATRATLLVAFDGTNPETYRSLRASEKSLALKLRALENIRKAGGGKVALMMCIAKGVNDVEMPELMKFFHERRDSVRGAYFMPLAHTWDPSRFDLEPERITSEDIEAAVGACFPGVGVEFIPAGVFGRMPNLMKLLGVKPPPFMGAHPNCESLYLLVSDGSTYVPLDYYMRSSLSKLIADLCSIEEALARRGADAAAGGRLARARAKWSAVRCLFRHVRWERALKGEGGFARAYHALAAAAGLLVGGKTRTVLARHTNLGELFQMIVLPFEDRFVLETDRLERCPNAFAFLDPDSGRVKTVPVCAWSQHKSAVMRRITDSYAVAAARQA
jgi:uncharacterized radical SAM superfamily Fe-S cluster-containing enzyme